MLDEQFYGSGDTPERYGRLLELLFSSGDFIKLLHGCRARLDLEDQEPNSISEGENTHPDNIHASDRSSTPILVNATHRLRALPMPEDKFLELLDNVNSADNSKTTIFRDILK